MNRLLTLIMALFLTSVAIAQEPATVQLPNDTLKLGALKIIKINGEVKKNWTDVIRYFDYGAVKLNYTPKKIMPNAELQTEWLAFDLGIAGYMDYTKYDATKAFTSPAVGIPVTKLKMQPKNSSTNVNIWVVQQKLNVYKQKYYLKYGLGFEMFNYYYANGRPFNAGGNPYGPNNSIQYNGNGSFNGSANLIFDDINNLPCCVGNLNSTCSLSKLNFFLKYLIAN